MGQQNKGGAPPMTSKEKSRLRTFLKDSVIIPILDDMIPNGTVHNGQDKYDETDFEKGLPILKRLVNQSVSGKNVSVTPTELQTLQDHLGLNKRTVISLIEEPVLGMAAVKAYDYMLDQHDYLDNISNDWPLHWCGNLTPADLKWLKKNYTETKARGPELDRMLNHIMPKLERNMKFRAYFKFRIAQEDADYKEAENAFKAPAKPKPTTTKPGTTTTPGTGAPAKPSNYVPPGQQIEDLFNMSSMAPLQFNTQSSTAMKMQLAQHTSLPTAKKPTALAAFT